jgi:hypothetical protein
MAKRIATVLTCTLVLWLAGCVSEAEMRRWDEAQCVSYGFKPGTTEFAGCLQREVLARRYGYEYPPTFYWRSNP